jgi:hypothetical protein
MDNLITCPKSGGSLCYVVEVSPEVKTYTSLSCGFWSNSLMTENSDFLKAQYEILPELYKDLAWEDPDTKLIWLPTTVNIPSKGMVFANGTSTNDWKWASVLAVEVKEEEKEKFKIPGKEGEYYEWKMDMTTKKEFPENEFLEALDYIGVWDLLA